MIEYPWNGSTTPAYLAEPAYAKGPGVVLIQEWWGLVDHIKDVTRRMAGEGFVVLAPDLYHGKETKSPDNAGKMLMALDIPRAAKEIAAGADYLLGLSIVSPKKIGVMGFCMGGQLALYVAQEHPENFHAAVDYYGIHPNAKVDPEKLKVPVLCHFAKRDKSVPEGVARSFVSGLEAAGRKPEAHFYDADHAFFNDTRPDVYHKENAELAWTRSIAFLRHHLKE